MSKKLKIRLLPNGEVQMETFGVKGKKCLDYIPLLEKIADVRVQKQEFTSEYHQANTEIEQEENVSTQN